MVTIRSTAGRVPAQQRGRASGPVSGNARSGHLQVRPAAWRIPAGCRWRRRSCRRPSGLPGFHDFVAGGDQQDRQRRGGRGPPCSPSAASRPSWAGPRQVPAASASSAGLDVAAGGADEVPAAGAPAALTVAGSPAARERSRVRPVQRVRRRRLPAGIMAPVMIGAAVPGAGAGDGTGRNRADDAQFRAAVGHVRAADGEAVHLGVRERRQVQRRHDVFRQPPAQGCEQREPLDPVRGAERGQEPADLPAVLRHADAPCLGAVHRGCCRSCGLCLSGSARHFTSNSNRVEAGGAVWAPPGRGSSTCGTPSRSVARTWTSCCPGASSRPASTGTRCPWRCPGPARPAASRRRRPGAPPCRCRCAGPMPRRRTPRVPAVTEAPFRGTSILDES